MKFGYILPNFGSKITGTDLVKLAEKCEELGFDSVWATDHVIMPAELKDPYGELIEPLTLLSFIAARTNRLRVGTSILVLPQRNPIIVAKQAAALDVLSKGRLTLGLGAGWAEKEFAFLGAQFPRRGRLMDEQILLMRTLWRDEAPEFIGEHYRVKDAVFLPKPLGRDIPIWIGGNDRHGLSRAIRLGDGWHPVGITSEAYAKGAAEIVDSGRPIVKSVRMSTDIRRRRVESDSSSSRRVTVSGPTSEVRKAIADYEAAGLDYYCASIMHPSAEDILADLSLFGSEVVRSY